MSCFTWGVIYFMCGCGVAEGLSIRKPWLYVVVLTFWPLWLLYALTRTAAIYCRDNGVPL